MKKYIISLLAVSATALTASAQHINKLYTMHVVSVGGSTVDFAFSNEPVMTFDGGQMNISSSADSDVKFQMDNVVNIVFSGEASGIATVKGDGLQIKVSASDGKIHISGMKANAKVAIFDASGALIANANADASGQAVVNAGNLGKGVFVVNTPENSFKFTK